VEIWDKNRFEQRQASDLEKLNSGELLKSSSGLF